MRVFAASRLSRWTVAAGLLTVAACLRAGDLGLPVAGNLIGSVVDFHGTPQIGASVQLFNKFERLIGRTTTGMDGRFAFASLPPDSYSVRVSSPTYLPVSRDRIAVKSGLDIVLQIHLATLLSSVQVSYAVPLAGMSNDWKWVLRSSPTTRPIVRYLPDGGASSSKDRVAARLFSGTHAMLSVSGGDASLADSDAPGADLGTGFALTTNIVGKHQLQVGGSYAQDTSGLAPAAVSLCAIYTRSEDTGGLVPAPEVAFSLSQFSLTPGQNAAPAAAVAPPVRSMTLSTYQTIDPLETVHVEYGIAAESVDYVQHITRMSPFARLTVSAGRLGELVTSFSDGGRPDQLTAHQPQHGALADASRADDLSNVADSLSRVSQFSYRDGRLQLQRTRSFETGYRKTIASRTFAVSVFHEDVSNGRVHVAGDASSLNSQDLLSDGVSNTSILNVGRYQRNGMLASVEQQLSDAFDLSVAYGRMGGFTANAPDSGNAAAGQTFLEQKSHNVASFNFAARVPKSGTRLSAGYGWMDGDAVVPVHVFTTQNSYISPGLSLFIRQPLPPMFGMPGHLELTGDVRNLLAQGYLPVNGQDGHTLLVVQSPRAVRGGVSFIF